MELSAVVDRLDRRLDTAAYADVDGSENGLQVGRDEIEVARVAVAVDAAVATIDEATAADADLLVVHHGLSWGGIDRVTGREYRRISRLIEGDVALYASHLPLDGHPELGNAAGLADLLGLEDRESFGSMGDVTIGRRGRLPEPTDVESLADDLAADLDTGDGSVRALDFGPDEVRDVAIVTGSGTDWLDEAVDVGADVLVTGEGKQQVYHRAREAGIGVVLAGHYATETFGVRSLAGLLVDWGLETIFVDCPTGL